MKVLLPSYVGGLTKTNKRCVTRSLRFHQSIFVISYTTGNLLRELVTHGSVYISRFASYLQLFYRYYRYFVTIRLPSNCPFLLERCALPAKITRYRIARFSRDAPNDTFFACTVKRSWSVKAGSRVRFLAVSSVVG